MVTHGCAESVSHRSMGMFVFGIYLLLHDPDFYFYHDFYF